MGDKIDMNDPENKALALVNKTIIDKAISIFGYWIKIQPFNDKVHPTVDELYSLAYNHQKKIVTDFEMMKKIFSKVNVKKLGIWNFILEDDQNLFKSFASSNGVSFPNYYYAVKSVVTSKKMNFDDLLNFLDSHFGKEIFPSFTYEDAAVILYIKPIFPWFFKWYPNYQKDISRYVNYLSFALKVVIEKLKNVEIDIYSLKNGGKSSSAAQNILIYLTEHHKID